jgi:hypothetical protein
MKKKNNSQEKVNAIVASTLEAFKTECLKHDKISSREVVQALLLVNCSAAFGILDIQGGLDSDSYFKLMQVYNSDPTSLIANFALQNFFTLENLLDSKETPELLTRWAN